MQTLAAYLFKADLDSDQVRVRMTSIENQVTAWLKKKGADEPASAKGSFASLSGDGEGRFSRSLVKSKAGTIDSTTLVEIAHTGQTFTTNILAIEEKSSVTLFSTLSVANEQSVIAPLPIYPRCPQVVRKLLTCYDDWKFGGRHLPDGKVVDAQGEEKAERLCRELLSPARNFPTIVVSMDADELVWEELPDQLARDMIGLAHVAVVDEEASWVMTDELGKADSCYLGAVRLYWPKINPAARGLRGSVWTPSRLRSFGTDNSGMKRFQSVLRGNLMSAAALTITPPACIREIHAAAIAESINTAKKSAVDRELNSIVEENHQLSQQLAEANRKIDELEWKLESFHRRLKSEVDEAAEPGDGASEDEAKDPPPEDGQLIYYKKIGNKGGVDILVRTPPCNHKESAWRSAFRGDQAEKGIAKLEGRDGWQSIQHCGACTGGGRWRVRW